MYTGSLPPASIHGTWSENVEIWSMDDDTLMDLSSVTEITLSLRDSLSCYTWMTLKMSAGEITIPSTGIVQWRAEQGQMSQLDAKNYEVLMVLEDETDKVPLILGTVSVME